MRKLLLGCMTFVAVSSFASAAAPDPTGTVSLVCTNVDSSIHKTLGLTLVIASAKWMYAETPEAPAYFPGVTAGAYFPLAPNDMILRDNGGQRVGELSPIVPGTAKTGDANIHLTIDVSGNSLSCKVV